MKALWLGRKRGDREGGFFSAVEACERNVDPLDEESERTERVDADADAEAAK